MIHPPSPHSGSRLPRRQIKGKSIPGRILSRFSFLVLVLMVLASWAGYQIASRNLSQSLSALPKFKAISQADAMSTTLEDIREKFIQFRNSTHEFTPESLRENFHLTFAGQEHFIQEIGVMLPDNSGFILFRDKDNFIELSHEVASTGSYAPFQQLLTFNLSLGKISLFPAVHYTPQGFANGAASAGEAVMRMALPVDDETVLMLGVNFKAWSDQLLPSALHKEFEEQARGGEIETLQLAYYFDNAGWILAERSNQPDLEWRPNIARRGFGGDFGRQGYDAAFRPWAQHESYWRMVTDTHEGRIGVIQESAGGYSLDFKHNYGFLCYAPIFFAANDSTDPTPIGGIAFFESAPNIFASSFETVGSYVVLLIVGFLFFIIVALRFGRRLARPFATSTQELQNMLEQRDLHYLQKDNASVEHGALVSRINTLITLTKGQIEQLSIMTATMQQTHAPLPIDIDRNISSAILAGEFGLVGSSKTISHVRENIHKAAQAGTDVLVWGETGTGKELVASAIHKASTRKNGPYISINCGALDENLLMDTLFGHVAGAFSDAVEDRKGAFLAANGGTLHLDELGNASPKVQQSLLRALSVRHIRPLGSDKEIPFDTRVIAATNVDLLKSANAGTFRQDLYYRLAIINIHIPPLRERKEDIPELAAFYIIESCKRLKKQTTYLSRGALKALTDHSWPGNVREFSNCLTRAVAYTEGDLILPEHIQFESTSRMYGEMGTDSPYPEFRKLQGSSSVNSHPVDYLWPAPSRSNFSLTKEAYDEQEHRDGSHQGQQANGADSREISQADGRAGGRAGEWISGQMNGRANGQFNGRTYGRNDARANFNNGATTNHSPDVSSGANHHGPDFRFQADGQTPMTTNGHEATTEGTVPLKKRATTQDSGTTDTPITPSLATDGRRMPNAHSVALTDSSITPEADASGHAEYSEQSGYAGHRDYAGYTGYSGTAGYGWDSRQPKGAEMSGQTGLAERGGRAPHHEYPDHKDSALSGTAPFGPAYGGTSAQGKTSGHERTSGHGRMPYQAAPPHWPHSAGQPSHHDIGYNQTSGLMQPPLAHGERNATQHGVGRHNAPQQTGYAGSSLTPKVLALYKQLMEKGDINDRQLEALILSHHRESFTRADYETISGTHVSSRTIQNDLKELLNLGLLTKSGNGPSTCYHKGDIPELQTRGPQQK